MGFASILNIFGYWIYRRPAPGLSGIVVGVFSSGYWIYRRPAPRLSGIVVGVFSSGG
jgi:hypothetical protein